MKSTKTYIVRSKVNPALILCTNGEFLPEQQVGPGGYSAKLYKTRKGAEVVRSGDVIVEEYKL